MGTGIVRCAYRNIVEVPPAYCTMNDLLADLLVALAAVIASSLLDRKWASL